MGARLVKSGYNVRILPQEAHMKFRSPGRVWMACAVSLFLTPIWLVSQQAVSHVRVVRLSYVSGTVAVKGTNASQWAKALVNTPLQEGFEVSTGADSFAEVQFENGSTARLGQFSRLAFDQLALDAEGNKLNRMMFEQGYATFHFLPEKHDAYSVKVAEATLTPGGKSLFRTDLEKSHVRVEVFNGSVDVAAPSGSAKLGKDKVLEFDTGASEMAFNIHHGTVKDSWDQWTEARDSQSSLALNDQAVAARGPVYGWSDLDAYGEWATFPGFGYGWMPFAPMGWAPYSMGMWGLYPGMGYTWISGEPWGWLPYHYGMWNFSPNFGWFWMPGNFGLFSPALVSWYTGSGWIGWAPLGVNPRQGVARPINTISGTAIGSGQLITPQNLGHAQLSEGTLTQHLPIEPARGTILTGTPLEASSASQLATHTAGAHSLAPATILMGGEGSKENALIGGRRLREPLRVRVGATLGGRYAVGGEAGEFRGDIFKGMDRGGLMTASRASADSRGSSQSRPSILPHGQSAETSRGGGEMPNASAGNGIPQSASSSQAGPPSSSHGMGTGAGGGHH